MDNNSSASRRFCCGTDTKIGAAARSAAVPTAGSMNSRLFDPDPKFSRAPPRPPKPRLDLPHLGHPGPASVNPPNCSVNPGFHTHTSA